MFISRMPKMCAIPQLVSAIRLVLGAYWGLRLEISVLKPGENNWKSVFISDARVGVFWCQIKANADRAQAAGHEFKERKIGNETL